MAGEAMTRVLVQTNCVTVRRRSARLQK